MSDLPIITRADLEAIHKSLLAKEAADKEVAEMYFAKGDGDKLTYYAGRIDAYNDAAWLVRMYLEGKVRTQEANRNA